MIIAQALLFQNGFRIVEAADEQVEFDKFSFHKTILSTHCSSASLPGQSHSPHFSGDGEMKQIRIFKFLGKSERR
jgi:hypothetical protein